MLDVVLFPEIWNCARIFRRHAAVSAGLISLWPFLPPAAAKLSFAPCLSSSWAAHR
jgi:hypothetical protein